MEYRNLDLSLISAKGLKNVNLISKMDVYAVVSIDGGDPRAKQKTPVDHDGSTSPSWNYPMKFAVDEAALRQNRLTLVVKLRCERSLGDKDVGDVHVPLKELIDGAGEGKSTAGPQFVTYQVRKPSGKAKGELCFSYKLGEIEKFAGAPVPAPMPVKEKAKQGGPVTAYPAGPSNGYPPQAYAAGHYPPPPPQPGYAYPPPQAGYGYPPQQPGYGYPPPQPGYGYPPPQTGYGYPPPQPGHGYPPVQKPPKKNNSRMGLGAGLLGGALGGLLIGDMVSDVGSYDAGYDAGFSDGGGFDF